MTRHPSYVTKPLEASLQELDCDSLLVCPLLSGNSLLLLSYTHYCVDAAVVEGIRPLDLFPEWDPACTHHHTATLIGYRPGIYTCLSVIIDKLASVNTAHHRAPKALARRLSTSASILALPVINITGIASGPIQSMVQVLMDKAVTLLPALHDPQPETLSWECNRQPKFSCIRGVRRDSCLSHCACGGQ